MPDRLEPLRLAVLSGKGGCGRSTVAINLAYMLAAAGRKVALVDLAQFGSLGVLLQVPHTPGTGLGPVAACLASIHQNELPDVLDSALVPCRMGNQQVSLLPAAAPQRQDDLLVTELVKVLESLNDKGFDLIIDTSHEPSDRLAAALHVSSHRLWVLTPDPAAGWHTLQAMEMARQLGVPATPSGVVVNRYHRYCGLRLPDLESAVGLPIWAVLPDIPRRLPLAAHRNVPLVVSGFGGWSRQLGRVLTQLGVGVQRPGLFIKRERTEAHAQV